MVITNAKYKEYDSVNIGVFATINGEDAFVPINTANSDYAEIIKQVADGTITIAEAD